MITIVNDENERPGSFRPSLPEEGVILDDPAIFILICIFLNVVLTNCYANCIIAS